MRGATQKHGKIQITTKISIHAPRERSDLWIRRFSGTVRDFNPRSSWEERLTVLLTLTPHHLHFNPRSSWEERHLTAIKQALHQQFQSTLLVRGATDWQTVFKISRAISIHAPRERSDTRTYCYFDQCVNISIHAPRERSDDKFYKGNFSIHISIHAPRERSDNLRYTVSCIMSDFNPRSSWEERPLPYLPHLQSELISIHAPRERSDLKYYNKKWRSKYFNPRSSWEERPLI